jgi:hypothetical protein
MSGVGSGGYALTIQVSNLDQVIGNGKYPTETGST